MVASSAAKFGPATMGLTTFRCASCLGGVHGDEHGQLEVVVRVGDGDRGSEEKRSWCVSTNMMSLNLVIDQ